MDVPQNQSCSASCCADSALSLEKATQPARRLGCLLAGLSDCVSLQVGWLTLALSLHLCATAAQPAWRPAAISGAAAGPPSPAGPLPAGPGWQPQPSSCHMSALQATASMLPSMLPQLQGGQVPAHRAGSFPATRLASQPPSWHAALQATSQHRCQDDTAQHAAPASRRAGPGHRAGSFTCRPGWQAGPHDGTLPCRLPLSAAGKMSQLQGDLAQGHLPQQGAFSSPHCKPTILLLPCPAGRLSRKGSTASMVPLLQGGQASAAGAGPASSAGPLPSDPTGKPQIRTVFEGMEAVAHAAKTVSLRGDTERLQLWSSWVDQVT